MAYLELKKAIEVSIAFLYLGLFVSGFICIYYLHFFNYSTKLI